MKRYEIKLVVVHDRLSGLAIKKLMDWTSENYLHGEIENGKFYATV